MSDESREEMLKKMLAIIRSNPGLRASEISRKMGLEHSWPYRKKLIEQGMVRKEKDGSAVRYYPVS